MRFGPILPEDYRDPQLVPDSTKVPLVPGRSDRVSVTW